jgi:hypothetical protein
MLWIKANNGNKHVGFKLWRSILDGPHTNAKLKLSLAFVVFAFISSPASAGTISFEGYVDSTVLTSQYPGLTFSNAVILSSGIGLNDLDFPPHSGSNVVSDDGGPITISFATPVSGFSGYLTYLEPLTITAFDAHNDPLAEAFSSFSDNLGTAGDPGSSPNEFLQVEFGSGIYSVSIEADPGGFSFTLDDASFQGITTVPEPSTYMLLFTGLAILSIKKNIKRRHV